MKMKTRLTPAGKERLGAYAQIVLGCLLGGAAYPLFLVPNNIAPGGLTGVTTILHYLYKLPVGLTSLIMNLPLFIISFRSIGKVFALRSLIGLLLFSAAIDLLGFAPVTDNTLLSALFGGMLLGAGLGLILRSNATTGGTDMIAKLLHKRFPFISVPAILFSIDSVVIIGAGIFINTEHALYALLCIIVSTWVMDAVLTGFTTAKACYIITIREDTISDRLMSELSRGVTYLVARGAYTGVERRVLLCVITSQELPRLKEIVRQEDEKAFMFVTGAHEALGEGFSNLMGES